MSLEGSVSREMCQCGHPKPRHRFFKGLGGYGCDGCYAHARYHTFSARKESVKAAEVDPTSEIG